MCIKRDNSYHTCSIYVWHIVLLWSVLAVVSLTPAELPFTAAIKSSVSLRDFLGDGSLWRQIKNFNDICAFYSKLPKWYTWYMHEKLNTCVWNTYMFTKKHQNNFPKSHRKKCKFFSRSTCFQIFYCICDKCINIWLNMTWLIFYNYGRISSF